MQVLNCLSNKPVVVLDVKQKTVRRYFMGSKHTLRKDTLDNYLLHEWKLVFHFTLALDCNFSCI